MKYQFSPFSDNLKNFPAHELVKLFHTHEGWFIDYKRELPDISKFAKVMSSFSNQKGGFIFIGVNENRKEMVASDFPGVPKEQIAEVLVKIRESASKHITPTPYFDTRVIYGPINEISLPEDKAIIIIGVPIGPNPPYIHSSGVVYVRQGDSSEPISENDRFRMDRLYERQNIENERFNNFFTNNYSKENPFTRLSLLTDPYFQNESVLFEFSEFVSHCNSTTNLSFIKFDNFQPTYDGYIARIINTNSPDRSVASLRWYFNGSAIINLPLSFSTFSKSHDLLSQHESGPSFYKILKEKGFSSRIIVDFSSWLISLTAIYVATRRIFQKHFCSSPIHAKLQYYNCMHTIPFINSKDFIDWVKINGVPIIEDTCINIPYGNSSDNLHKFSLSNNIDLSPESEYSIAAAELFQISLYLFRAIGLLEEIYCDKEMLASSEERLFALLAGGNKLRS